MVAITTLFTGMGAGLGGLGSMFGGKKKGFQRKLKLADFSDTGSLGAGAVAVSSDKFYKLAQFTVPAQQSITLGFGDAGQPLNQGYVYVYLKDYATTEIKGVVRFAVANANETAIDVQLEMREDQLNGDLNDKSKMTPMPEITGYPVLGRQPREDDKIQIYFKSDDATKTISNTTSIVYLPVTVYM
jgi:hypothetical protein